MRLVYLEFTNTPAFSSMLKWWKNIPRELWNDCDGDHPVRVGEMECEGYVFHITRNESKAIIELAIGNLEEMGIASLTVLETGEKISSIVEGVGEFVVPESGTPFLIFEDGRGMGLSWIPVSELPFTRTPCFS